MPMLSHQPYSFHSIMTPGIVVTDGLDVELPHLTSLRAVVLKSLEARAVVPRESLGTSG